MSNIDFIRERLSTELECSVARRDEYKAGIEGLGFPANFALEQHYEGKVEAFQYALNLLNLLDDESKK